MPSSIDLDGRRRGEGWELSCCWEVWDRPPASPAPPNSSSAERKKEALFRRASWNRSRSLRAAPTMAAPNWLVKSKLSWVRSDGSDGGGGAGLDGGAGGGTVGAGGGTTGWVLELSLSPGGGGSASMLLPWLLRPLLLVEGALTMMVGIGIELFSTEPFPSSVPWPWRRSSTFDCFTKGPFPLRAPPFGMPPAPAPIALRSVLEGWLWVVCCCCGITVATLVGGTAFVSPSQCCCLGS